MIDLNQLADKTKELGAVAAGFIKTSDIQFSEEFRMLCQQNSCGHYGTNWMCPPAIKSFEKVKAKVLNYSKGVVFQSVCRLEDSFDYDGMMKGKDFHFKIFNRILEYIKSDVGCSNVLALNAGACKVCEKCTYPDEQCRYPDKAVSSIEAYGIDVYALLSSCNIPYNNGPNTVFYAGLFLF